MVSLRALYDKYYILGTYYTELIGSRLARTKQ